MSEHTVHHDSHFFEGYCNDLTYNRERRVVQSSCRLPRLLGKLYYGISHPQAFIWSREKRLAMKMSTVYHTAKELLADFGIPRELLDITDPIFGRLGGKPHSESLRRSVRFICVAWHARMARAYCILVDHFKKGESISSYGCGSGIIELLALIASNNRNAKLTLIDIDPDNIALAQELIALFEKCGYNVRGQVTMILGDIRTCALPNSTDVAVSIGLLHNYFPLREANSFMEEWFNAGAKTVITDICYGEKETKDNDTRLRLNFINRVLGWKFGPPDGLLFYSKEEFLSRLPNRTVELYDHGPNATITVAR